MIGVMEHTRGKEAKKMIAATGVTRKATGLTTAPTNSRKESPIWDTHPRIRPKSESTRHTLVDSLESITRDLAINIGVSDHTTLIDQISSSTLQVVTLHQK